MILNINSCVYTRIQVSPYCQIVSFQRKFGVVEYSILSNYLQISFSGLIVYYTAPIYPEGRLAASLGYLTIIHVSFTCSYQFFNYDSRPLSFTCALSSQHWVIGRWSMLNLFNVFFRIFTQFHSHNFIFIYIFHFGMFSVSVSSPWLSESQHNKHIIGRKDPCLLVGIFLA